MCPFVLPAPAEPLTNCKLPAVLDISSPLTNTDQLAPVQLIPSPEPGSLNCKVLTPEMVEFNICNVILEESINIKSLTLPPSFTENLISLSDALDEMCKSPVELII